jgi:hypothetical protein
MTFKYDAINGGIVGLIFGFAMTAPVMLMKGYIFYGILSIIDLFGISWVLYDRNYNLTRR